MNEFIVWDDIKREFTNNVTYFMSFNEDGTINSYNGFGETKYFQYIGLRDTEDNKIYTDSSIVEFDDESKSKAYVRFRNFAYEFYFFESGGFNKLFEYDFEKTRIKIIDTLQENKLGLISE